MNKIGIVSWYKSNFGSALQAYALSKVIEGYGFETEFINIFRGKRYALKRCVRNMLFHLIYHKSAKTRDNIDYFVENKLTESPPLYYNELFEYSKKYAAVVCGSDQIWSCVDSVDPFYFLQFVSRPKRIAYAPSIGLNGIRKDLQPLFKDYVSQFPELSVREEKGSDIINQLTGLTAKVVLDPTLLLTSEEWLKLACKENCKKYNLEKNGYILCYFLGDKEKYDQFTLLLQQITGKKVVCVSFKRTNRENQIVCTVEGFLALIRDAAYVLTDSFHGTAFSINLQKKVAVFERFSDNDYMNQNSRIYNLLSKIDAKNILTRVDENPQKFVERVDFWDEMYSKLSKERLKSFEYLSSCLKRIDENI